MLIKPSSTTPTSSLKQSYFSSLPPTTTTRRYKKQQSKDFQLRHECWHLRYTHNCHNHHQQHYLWQYLQKQRPQRCILLLIALIMLQQVELHACRQLAQRSIKSRLSPIDESIDISTSSLLNQAQNFDLPQSKRAELVQSSSIGQPEQIFAVDERMESNYDEYPMIVPKRAALLLDRLMVALHNALEKGRETEQHRIGELNPKYKNGKDSDSNISDEADLDKAVPQFDNMYGDDPAVMMDYDFKDLNSINRATGETFFGKNLQRRAKLGGGDSMALLASSLATGATTRASGKSLSSGGIGIIGGGGGSSGGRLNTGRLYWRCYFNAITCF